MLAEVRVIHQACLAYSDLCTPCHNAQNKTEKERLHVEVEGRTMQGHVKQTT